MDIKNLEKQIMEVLKPIRFLLSITVGLVVIFLVYFEIVGYKNIRIPRELKETLGNITGYNVYVGDFLQYPLAHFKLFFLDFEDCIRASNIKGEGTELYDKKVNVKVGDVKILSNAFMEFELKVANKVITKEIAESIDKAIASHTNYLDSSFSNFVVEEKKKEGFRDIFKSREGDIVFAWSVFQVRAEKHSQEVREEFTKAYNDFKKEVEKAKEDIKEYYRRKYSKAPEAFAQRYPAYKFYLELANLMTNMDSKMADLWEEVLPKKTAKLNNVIDEVKMAFDARKLMFMEMPDRILEKFYYTYLQNQIRDYIAGLYYKKSYLYSLTNIENLKGYMYIDTTNKVFEITGDTRDGKSLKISIYTNQYWSLYIKSGEMEVLGNFSNYVCVGGELKVVKTEVNLAEAITNFVKEYMNEKAFVEKSISAIVDWLWNNFLYRHDTVAFNSLEEFKKEINKTRVYFYNELERLRRKIDAVGR